MLTKEYNPIPQNDKKNFEIIKGNWSYSIDIKFEHFFEINILNLYAILKSYLVKEEHAIKQLLIISFQNESISNPTKYHSLSIKKFKKMDFLDFEEYYIQLYEDDYYYISTHKFYGFRIVFFSESIYWKNQEIYPIYPWNYYIQKEIIDRNSKYFNYTNLRDLNELKKENENLKKRLKDLEEIIKKILVKEGESF